MDVGMSSIQAYKQEGTLVSKVHNTRHVFPSILRSVTILHV